MQYRILGPLEVESDGGIVPLRATKQRVLLAVLLLHANDIVSTDRLIEDLWADDLPTRAENALQVYVSQLRKVLTHGDHKGSDVLVTQRPGYRLEVKAGELDLERFVTLCAQARAELENEQPDLASSGFRKALELWRGEPLADFTFDPFAEAEIERLKELRVRAIEDRVQADLELGRDADLVSELESLVREQPLRERLREELMLALYRSGRQADALTAYRDATETLREELGIDPGPDLQRLHERVLRQDETLARPATSIETSLPNPPNAFIGRHRDVEAISAAIRDGARLVSLTGTGGTGKTRLAIEVAKGLTASFPDGTFFVDLAAVRDPTLVGSTISAALHLKETSGEELEAMLVRLLHDRRALLVLDNFEQLLEAAPFIAHLIGATETLALLITSRVRLHLSGEREVPVAPFELPDGSGGIGLRDNPAVVLFGQRAQAVDPGFVIDDDNLDTVAEICRRLDGLPLAIELAAARVKLLPPRAILARLDHRLTLLIGGPRDVSERQRSLSAAIDWSFRSLGDEERELFSSLSVLAGTWDLLAAAAIGGDDDRSETEVLDLLSSLLDHSLIYRVPTRDEPRFSMLETLRDFASAQLKETGRTDEVLTRHASHFRDIAEAEDRGFREGSQGAWIERVRDDLGNYRVGLDRAIRAGDAETAARIAAALGQYWCLSGQLSEGRRWVEEALTLSPSMTPVSLSRLLDAGGRIAYRQSAWDDSVAMHERALQVSQDERDDPGTAAALNGLALVAFARGDLGNAEALFRRSLELGRQIEDTWRIQSALGGLAGVLYARDEHAEAVQLLEESLAISRSRGDLDGAGAELSNLAEIALAQQDFERARTCAEEAAGILRTLEEVPHLANAELKHGLAVLMCKGPVDAAPLLRDALRLAMEIGDSWVASEALEGLALVRSLVGDETGAVRMYGAANGLKHVLGLSVPSGLHEQFERDVSRLSKELGSRFDAIWSDGESLSIEEAVRLASDTLLTRR